MVQDHAQDQGHHGGRREAEGRWTAPTTCMAKTKAPFACAQRRAQKKSDDYGQ